MKKVGRFLLCFLPTVAALLLQTIVSIPVMMVMMVGKMLGSSEFADMVTAGASGAMPDTVDITNMVMSMIKDKAFITDVSLTTLVYYNTLAIIGFGLFYGLAMKNKYPGKIKEACGVTSILGVVIMFVGFESIVSAVMLILQQLIPAAFVKYNQLIEESGLGQLSLVSTLAAVVLAPIAEEIIFRGVTFKLARRFTAKFWLANAIQAAIFGIMHMNVIQGIYAFAMGLILGLVYSKFHSLFATIIAHLSFNLAGTWLVAIIYMGDEEVPLLKTSIITLVSIIACVIGYFLIEKNRKTPGNVERFRNEYACDNPEYALISGLPQTVIPNEVEESH